MATLNGVIQYSGKLGQTVGMKGQNGKNYVRVRRDTIKNPRSAGQAIQRMIASTVAVSMGYLTEILNNSVESKSNGAATLNYLRSLWMNMLRTADAASAPSTHNYLPKGQKLFIPNRYQLSQGRLVAPAVTLDENVITFDKTLSDFALATATASVAFPDVRVGDQITVIAISESDGGDATTADYCRFAFKDDTTPCFIEDNAEYYLNPAAIDLAKASGNWDQLVFGFTTNKLTIGLQLFQSLYNVIAVGVIVSNIENKQRSTSYLVVDPYADVADYAGGDVYPTYMGSSTDIDLASEIYLNNSARRNAAAGVIISGVTLGSNSLPSAIGTDNSSVLSVPCDAAPQSLKVNLRSAGRDFVSEEIVGAAAEATLASHTEEQVGTVVDLSVETAGAFATDHYNVTLYAPSEPVIISGGSGVLADGTPFTF